MKTTDEFVPFPTTRSVWRHQFKKMTNCLLYGITFLVASIMLATEAHPQSLTDAFERNRRRLFANNTDLLRMKLHNAKWYEEFLGRIEHKEKVNDRDLERALVESVQMGKQEHLMYRNTGYIEDEMVIDIVAAGLNEKDANIREYATRELANECRDSSLKRIRTNVLANLKEPQSHEEWRLYGKLATGEKELLALRGRNDAPKEVRARAGGRGIEEQLIASFENETEYSRKRDLARQLGYIATERCATVLAKGLQSEVMHRGPVEERSIRGDILLALGRIYQTEPLFTMDAVALTQGNDDQFNRLRGISEYAADVDAWVRRNFSHSAWGAGPIWFVRYLPHPRY